MSDPDQATNEALPILDSYREALERGDNEAMENAAVQLMALACEQLEKEPSPELLLKMEAHEYENAGDWLKAEMAHRRALDLAQAQNNAALICKGHCDLSGLFAFLDQKQQALEEADFAVEAAKRANIPALLAMALESQARRRLQLGRSRQALEAANEILGVLDEGKTADTMRARAFVLRARCHAELRDGTAAHADLDSAWLLLNPRAGIAMFAGVQSALATWWEVTALLQSDEGDFKGAAEAWRTAVEYSRQVSQLPHVEGPYKFAPVARNLHHLGQALESLNDRAGATEAFRESREIQARIGLPRI